MFLRKLIVVFILVLCAAPAVAAPLKVYVAEFKVTGGADKEGLVAAMQSLLASRLAGENVTAVGKAGNPDLTVSGTYISFGKIFSIDAQLAEKGGDVIGRAFEQGDSADEVIPAVTRLAQKLGSEISKSAGTVTTATVPSVAPVSGAAPSPAIIIKKNEGDILKPEDTTTKSLGSGMIGQRLKGEMIGISEVKKTTGSERLLAIALEDELRLYTQGKELKLLYSMKDIGANGKVIAIDAADADADGTSELYVTIFHEGELSSQVFLVEKEGFRRIASDLPYFFRAIALKGGMKKVYAQQIGRMEDYYGGLYEVVKKGENFTIENQISLPKLANLFNTNQIAGSDGKTLFVSLNSDNYLTVSDDKNEQLWKSSDKYGGSETYFSRDDSQNQRFTGSKLRKIFLEQRITITKSGTIIVPKNEGFFVVGDSRSFTKNSIYAFKWNGASLDELWHTKLSQNYLADYFYDADNKELLVVEVVKREGLTDKGASAVSIKKVE